MDHTPYEPPANMRTQPVPGKRSFNETLFFALNFSFSLLFFAGCVVSIGVADNAYAWIGGVILVLPTGIYATAEWICWYRNRSWLKRPLGVSNLFLAAFFLFGLVTNLGEAIMDSKPIDIGFAAVFVLSFVAISGYLGFCGWRRVHDAPPLARIAALDQHGG